MCFDASALRKFFACLMEEKKTLEKFLIQVISLHLHLFNLKKILLLDGFELGMNNLL